MSADGQVPEGHSRGPRGAAPPDAQGRRFPEAAPPDAQGRRFPEAAPPDAQGGGFPEAAPPDAQGRGLRGATPPGEQGGERQVPFYCPYCGDEDLRPSGPAGGSWRCGACARSFELRFAGVAAAGRDGVPAGGGASRP